MGDVVGGVWKVNKKKFGVFINSFNVCVVLNNNWWFISVCKKFFIVYNL